MLKKSLITKHDISLSIRFVTGITQELESNGIANFKQKLNCDSDSIVDYKCLALNKEQRKYEQIKYDVQTKICRKNQIEHHFDVVDRQLQIVMKKKMFVHFIIIK